MAAGLEWAVYHSRSFRRGLEPGFLHDLHPLVVVLADTLIEFLRRAAAGDHAVTFKVLLDRRISKGLVDRRVEPVDDGLRRAARRHGPEPEHDFVSRQRLGHGGN